MKDKEKAKQIVDRIFECGFNTNRTFYDMALNSAMEMAEWKDKQFSEERKQWVEKACEWLFDYIKYYDFNTESDIREFRKAMEE